MPSSIHFEPQVSYNLTATIANGQSASAEIDLAGTTLCGLIIPSAITGTAFAIQMADASGGTFIAVQDGSGSDVSIAVAASKYIPINNLAVTAGLRFIKIVSNGTEAAQRSIKLVTRAV